MFGLTSRRARRAPVSHNRVRLNLQTLESRHCPSADITGLASQPVGNGSQVEVTGTVTGTDPSTTTVQLSGAVSGSATPNASGSFDVILANGGAGPIQAQINGASYAAHTALSVHITSVQRTAPGVATITGIVTDDNPGGVTVSFAGTVGGTVSVNNNGTFTYVTTPRGVGAFTATALDLVGATSNTGGDFGHSSPGLSISVYAGSGTNEYVVSGVVTDDSPGGLTVSISGLVSATATTDSVGNYSATVTLAPGSAGTVHGSVTDAWSLTATADTYFSC